MSSGLKEVKRHALVDYLISHGINEAAAIAAALVGALPESGVKEFVQQCSAGTVLHLSDLLTEREEEPE